MENIYETAVTTLSPVLLRLSTDFFPKPITSMAFIIHGPARSYSPTSCRFFLFSLPSGVTMLPCYHVTIPVLLGGGRTNVGVGRAGDGVPNDSAAGGGVAGQSLYGLSLRFIFFFFLPPALS